METRKEHRKTWTEADARRLLNDWSRSGELLSVFARRQGVHPQRLAWWRRRLARGAHSEGGGVAIGIASTSAFVPVTVRGMEREPCAAAVEFDAGLRVELRALDGASAAWIAALARALGGAS